MLIGGNCSGLGKGENKWGKGEAEGQKDVYENDTVEYLHITKRHTDAPIE